MQARAIWSDAVRAERVLRLGPQASEVASPPRRRPRSIRHDDAPERAGASIGLRRRPREGATEGSLRKRLEAQVAALEGENRKLLAANKSMSVFLASMSHELRTPLNSIIGFADLLLMQEAAPTGSEQHEYLVDILRSANHVLQLVNEVLDIAKIEAGKMEVHPEQTSARQAVQEVCRSLKPLLAKKQIELTTEFSEEIDSVTVDVLRFKQILYNLLSNAIKFTERSGHIALQVMPRGKNHFVLSVRDSGSGIPTQDLPKLFGEFDMLDRGAGARRGYQGSGLGLFLTKKLVELHGGTIEVESTLGVGTTFNVGLPRATGSEGEPRRADPFGRT
jgi:signal transduction histidine kinase